MRSASSAPTIFPQQHHFQRLPLADEPWQSLRAAASGYDANVNLRLADAEVADGHDAQVAGEGELAAAATALAVYGRDDGLRQVLQAQFHPVKRHPLGTRRLGRRLAVGHARQLRDVEVGDEDAIDAAGKDDDPHGIVALNLLYEGVDLVHHTAGHEVARRVADGANGDLALFSDLNLFVFHVHLLTTRWSSDRAQYSAFPFDTAASLVVVDDPKGRQNPRGEPRFRLQQARPLTLSNRHADTGFASHADRPALTHQSHLLGLPSHAR